MKCLSALVAFLFFWPVFAATQTLPDEDPAIEEKVRKRQYLGGVDEEDLKVQDELPTAKRKMDRASIHKQVFDSLESAAEKEAKEAKEEAKESSEAKQAQ